jgi:3-oxoacyl-(acyl-carrier-protein) synthase
MAASIGITGLGIICAIGNNAGEVRDALLRKESGIGPLRYLPSLHTELPVGEIKMSTAEMMEMLGVDEPLASRTALMGAIAVKEALADAGIRDVSGKRVALISGTTVGVMDVTEVQFEKLGGMDPGIPRGNECGKSTQDTARYAGLESASCCTISTACSSALNALMIGAEMLLRDEVDLVVAGGTEGLSKFHLNGFNSLMILDHERCRPFDDTRAGLNLGEGAAYVVLEKNAPGAMAYIAGYANRCDAFHQTATSADGDGAFLAMTGALDRAGLVPEDIRYINAHGTATPDNDVAESNAFHRVFGEAIPEMSSTKSYTGHTTSASGSIEAVICVLAMRGGFTPASLGWSRPIPGGAVPTPGHTGVRLENVMCNAFGFGGNDSSMIFSLQERMLSCTDSYGVREAARVRIDTPEDLPSLNEFYTPMETRRMCRLMKAALLSAFRALRSAGLEKPEAILSATSTGMLETSTQFLSDIVANKEQMLKPTLFMMCTHNTIASAIAIRTKCHGYNCTYSQSEESTFWAMRDARRLIASGEAASVLVCSFDENCADGVTTDFFAETVILTRDA